MKRKAEEKQKKPTRQEDNIMKPQQECITAYVFPQGIYLLPDGHPSIPKVIELFKEKGIRKHRLWRRRTKNISRYYIETGIFGSYETAGIKDITLDGKPIPLFEDTELKEQVDCLCLERHMEIAGKKFAVSSVFPKAATSTPTNKLLSLIDKEQETERKSS